MCRQHRRRARDSRPFSPVSAARSGRITGKGRKLRVVAREPRQQTRRAGTRTCPRPRRRGSPAASAARRTLGRAAGRSPRRSARRGRRRCRRRRLQRLQAAIGRALAFAFRRPGEESSDRAPPSRARASAAAGRLWNRRRASPRASPEAGLGNSAPSCPPARSTTCHVPFSSGGRSAIDCPRGSISDGEQLLVERARERVFLQAPAGGEPVRRNEEDDRLAAVRRLVQRPLPALARPRCRDRGRDRERRRPSPRERASRAARRPRNCPCSNG